MEEAEQQSQVCLFMLTSQTSGLRPGDLFIVFPVTEPSLEHLFYAEPRWALGTPR